MAEVPTGAAEDIAARMGKGDDLQFGTAWSELMLHQALRRLGFELTPHPDVPGTTKHLDFLISRAGERQVYIEITTINPPDKTRSRNRREAEVFEALNGAALPDDLFLSYEVLSYGKASPSKGKIKSAVERWAHERRDIALDGTRVVQEFPFDDWCLRLLLLPAIKPRPGGRRIAIYGTLNGRMMAAPPSSAGLRKALDAKATKYGDLDLPYLITIFDRTDSLAYLSSEFPRQVSEVLFGSERSQSSGGEIFEVRANDGWFGCPEVPRRLGVSAVLVFPSADPWHLADHRMQPLLVRNPWAARPFPEGILPTGELIIDKRAARVTSGRSMADILELPTPWPPDED